MLSGLIYFLVGALVLVVVLYVTKLVMDMIEMPAQMKQIVWIILGLICLILLVVLVCNAFAVGPVGLRW